MADRRLSNEAVRLACILSMFDMSKKKQGKEQGEKIHEGIVFPSISTLSEAMGRSEPMIIKYVNELCKAGYLVRRKRFTKTNLYIMWLPNHNVN